MRVSSRAIIVEDGKLLTMFRRRIKDGKIKEYYVIPGGGLEEGETLQQNVTRELKEEMNVDIKILGYLGRRDDETTSDNYFHCKITKCEPKLGGEELDRMTKENFYEPRFVDVAKLDSIDLYGKEFVEKALKKDYLNQIEK